MNKNSWKIKRLGEISELQSGNGFPVEFQGGFLKILGDDT